MWALVLVVGMLFTGTLNTIAQKIQNDAYANGTSRVPHAFTHPWFQTMLMFLGEMLCLVGYAFVLLKDRFCAAPVVAKPDDWDISESDGVTKMLMKKDEPPQLSPSVFQWVLIMPTLCDLTGSTLGGIGLLYTTASVWQMLRGSIVIFSGIMSVIFLDLKMTYHHYYGMAIVTLGLFTTGYSSFVKSSSGTLLGDFSSGEMILGIGLTVLGRLISSCQYIVEEQFVKKRNLPPLVVVGMEGLFRLPYHVLHYLACDVLRPQFE